MFGVLVTFGLILWLFCKKEVKNIDVLFVLWFVLFFIYVSLTPHKEIRYLIPIALPVFLLSAKGFYDCLSNIKGKYKPYITAVFSIALLIYIGLALNFDMPLINQATSEEMDASRYIVDLNDKNAVIYSNFNYPVFAYYTNTKTIRLDSYDQNFYEKYPGNMPNPGYILIYKNSDIPPTQEWLDAHADNFKIIKETEHILIYKYEPKK